MGSDVSKLIEVEKQSWVLPHDLSKNQRLAQSQISLLSNFGPKLHLCYKENTIYGYQYEHWFVTDDMWTIEFGGGEIENTSVLVHNNPKGTYKRNETFVNSNDVRNRMAKVCGTVNYSLALRNCEHVARYIHCGMWACFQMTGEGVLRKILFNHMTKQHTKLINKLPLTLMPVETAPVQLHQGIVDFIRDPIIKNALTSGEDSMFSILFLGPTGWGKSTIINQMFNSSVCKADGGIYSVTKEINYIQGMYNYPYEIDIKGKWAYHQQSKVNIIDTVGFCDNLLTSRQVLSLAHLDTVVICCSGRLEAEHKKAIKQFMDWLEYSKHKQHFVFFYTKADTMSVEDKQRNLLAICEELGIDRNSTCEFKTEKRHIKQEIKRVDTISFSPNASSPILSENRDKLMKAVLAPTHLWSPNERITVTESSCNIL